MILLRAVRESSRKLMLFHCLHQHCKARSNRGNVPSASELGNRINEVPARKMSRGKKSVGSHSAIISADYGQGFFIVWFLKHITLVSSLDQLITKYTFFFHSTDEKTVTQYVSEMVQKSNTYESVGSKISLILHRPYIYFCVMPRGSSASVFVGFLGWDRREEQRPVSILSVVLLGDRSPCCFYVNILLYFELWSYNQKKNTMFYSSTQLKVLYKTYTFEGLLRLYAFLKVP